MSRQALEFRIRSLDDERASSIKCQDLASPRGKTTSSMSSSGSISERSQDIPDVEFAYAEGGTAGDGYVLVELVLRGFPPECVHG